MRLLARNAASYQGREPLTDDTLRAYAPSIFAEAKHASRSERYAYIPTIHVLNGLRKEGFLPFYVAQSRTRHEDRREFTKHLLRLRHVNHIQALTVGSEFPEISLLNSHDGTSSYQMDAGIYRLVCSNGLIVDAGDVQLSIQRISSRYGINQLSQAK